MTGAWRVRILLTLAIAVPVAVSASSQSGSVVIRAKKIYTITHGMVQNGEILVQDGKIKEVGQKVNARSGAQEYSAEVVVPGFVDAHTHLALDRIGNGGRVILPGYMDDRAFANDWTGDLKFQVQNNEDLEPIMPEMNIRHWIDVWFPSFVALRELGVVAQNITPGLLNMIGGSGVVMKTPGMDLDEKVKVKVPLTLDATVAMIRDALTRAKGVRRQGAGPVLRPASRSDAAGDPG
jgi:hypothetical protein